MLLSELNRRNVYRVAIAYLAISWFIIEVAETLLPSFGVPDWAFRFLVILLALGFIPALVFSWVYEMTPEGLKRESEVARDQSITHISAKRLDVLTIVFAVLAASILLADRFWLDPQIAPSSDQITEKAKPQIQRVSEPVAKEFSSIAVLPFANRSASPDDAYFVDGIHDDLLTHISHIDSIKTISRTSVMQYRNSTKSIPEIARELGVGIILEGAVQRAGDQVRVTVQLIDARSDANVWSETFDRQLTAANIFAIQSEIARNTADALRATLNPLSSARFKTAPTDNLNALDVYFRGRQSMATRSVASLAQAIDHFTEAIEHDPAFALAYVGLADAYRLHNGYAGLYSEEIDGKAREAVDHALMLDPQLGEAYATLATLLLPDLDAAESAFRQAILLNPNYAPAYQWYGEVLSLRRPDRVTEALDMMRRALSLDPMSAIINNDFGEVLEIAGNFDKALAQYELAIKIDPRFVSGYRRIGELQAFAFGRFDKAVLAYMHSEEMEPGQWLTAEFLGNMYLHLGDIGLTKFWYERAISLIPPGGVSRLGLDLNLFLEEEDAAIIYANRMLGTNNRFVSALRTLGYAELQSGDYEVARERYLNTYPELIQGEDNDQLYISNVLAAGDLAIILWEAGEREEAKRLIDLCHHSIAAMTRLGLTGYGILDARIAALRGNRSEALSILDRAVDQGWRSDWWYHFNHDPVLEILHDEPKFRQLKQKVEEEMAVQLARLKQT